MTYKVGMRVRISGGGVAVNDTYLLAQVGPKKVCAVGLKDGNRFVEPVDVANAYKLTTDELWKILGCRVQDRWTLSWRHNGNRIFSVDSGSKSV